MRLTHFAFISSLALLCASLAQADICTAPGNLVSNCGFETGDLTGWQLSGAQSSAAFSGITYGVDGADSNSGQYSAYLGAYGAYLTLSQTVATTPGERYSVSFYLAQPSPTPNPGSIGYPYGNGFNVYFNGSELYTTTNASYFPYTEYQYTATATAATAMLSFSARDDTDYFRLDDVSVAATAVTATPEPSAVLSLLLGLPLVLVWRRSALRAKQVAPGR